MKPRILLVDDDPELAYVLRRVLEETERYEVQVEIFSTDALEAAKTFRPDLVILDLNMPGKDGFQVAAEIAAERSLEGAQILFMTGMDVDDEQTRNVGTLLAKPVRMAELINAVDGFLADRA